MGKFEVGSLERAFSEEKFIFKFTQKCRQWSSKGAFLVVLIQTHWKRSRLRNEGH